MQDHHAEKAVLRRQAAARRRELDREWRRKACWAIHRRLFARPELEAAQVISTYASIHHEVETHSLIREFLAQHKRVALPCVIHKPHSLELRVINSFPAGCSHKDYGILEPDPMVHPEVIDVEQVDILLAPGLLFTRNGYRLGYGGGYYDGLLVSRPRLITIGLAFSTQIVDDFPRDPWDRPLDAVCTDTEWIDAR